MVPASLVLSVPADPAGETRATGRASAAFRLRVDTAERLLGVAYAQPAQGFGLPVRGVVIRRGEVGEGRAAVGDQVGRGPSGQVGSGHAVADVAPGAGHPAAGVVREARHPVAR